MPAELAYVKWKNIDSGAGYYYITSTFTEWTQLFRYSQILHAACEEIVRAIPDGGYLSAYVFMPDHLHMLAYLAEAGLLHRFCKLWRGRSARRITDFLAADGREDVLRRMALHASGGARYAVWEEQVRSLPIWSQDKLGEKVNYIHANPVRKGYVSSPDEWPYSSWLYYEGDGRSLMPITPYDMCD
jgi:putative transposase